MLNRMDLAQNALEFKNYLLRNFIFVAYFFCVMFLNNVSSFLVVKIFPKFILAFIRGILLRFGKILIHKIINSTYFRYI